MIVQSNENPLNSLYYLVFLFLQWLKYTDESIFDLDDLYDSFNSTLNKKISFGKFLLLIDWLHINDSASIQDNGNIKIDVFNKN